MPKPIQVLIADDHPIFRRGLRMVIEADSRIKVVAEAEDGQTTLDAIAATDPEVAVLDIDMPAPDGLTIVKVLRQKKLRTIPIFLTMHKDEELFNAALDLGVRGFVVKDSAITEIVECIKAVATGNHYYSPLLSGFLVNRSTRSGMPDTPGPSLSLLTPSERRVLRLLAESKTNKEIAEDLCISARTIEHHRAHICEKLGISGKHALLTFALNHKNEL
ncbi:MAG: response regulator transcription factor [Acidobacteria bacterium]|nr:response regulator transcription factor [Acidobacteriota bacterium]